MVSTGANVNVLVVYASTEGQTRKISAFISARLATLGNKVTEVDASAVPHALSPKSFDAAILAGSLHVGRYQPALLQFAREHREQLNALPALLISVSLSAAGSDANELRGIAECAERFKRETGWHSAQVHQAAGAFHYTQYSLLKRWAMTFIAWRKGVATDQDLEFTNWDALAKIIDAFNATLTRDSLTTSNAKP